jgi:riboflavin transporter
MTNTQKNIYKITLTAVFSAISFLLMFIEISLPIIPSFIKFDISDLPALIGTFSIGPIYGVLIELLKNILHILICGTSSAGVGEISNFILGAVFCLVTGLIYKSKRIKNSAVIGCIIGAVIMGIVSLPLNYFIVYPAYVKFYGMPLEAIIGLYQEILKFIGDKPTQNSLFNCLLIFNVPFTVVKGLIDAALCGVIIKPLSKIIKQRKN